MIKFGFAGLIALFLCWFAGAWQAILVSLLILECLFIVGVWLTLKRKSFQMPTLILSRRGVELEGNPDSTFS